MVNSGTRNRGMADEQVALIVVASDILREGLRVLLTAVPELRTVYHTANTSAALKMDLSQPPALILFDMDSASAKSMSSADRLRFKWPQARILALVKSNAAGQIALASSADAVIIKGYRAEKLIDVVRSLLGLSCR